MCEGAKARRPLPGVFLIPPVLPVVADSMVHFFVVLSHGLVVLLSVFFAFYIGRTTYFVGKYQTLALMLLFLGLGILLRKGILARPAFYAALGAVLFVAGCTGIWLKFYLTKTTKDHLKIIEQPGVEAVYLFHGEDDRTAGDSLELNSHPREVRQDAREDALYITHGIGGGPARKETINSVVRVNLNDADDRSAIRGATSRAVAVNHKNGEIYVGMWAENCMLVLDGKEGKVKKRIPTNPRPWNLLVDYEENRLILLNEWEVSSKSSSIEVFDLDRLEKVGEKSYEKICAYAMVKSRNDGRLFISSWFPGTLLSLDGNDFSIFKKRTMSLCVFGLALDEAAGSLYVAIPVMAKIAVLDMDTLKTKYWISTEFSCRNLVMDDERNLLYAGGWINGTLDIIDLEARRSIKKLYLGRRLRGISQSADRRILFAVSQSGVFRIDLEAAGLPG